MKKIAAAFITGVVFASASSIFAGEAIKKVQAVLAQDVTVKVDGEKVNLQNTPITYGGATYLPVRDAANAVGAELKWDSKTKTVELTTSGQQKEAPVKVQEPQATAPQPTTSQPEPAKPAPTGQNQEGGKDISTNTGFIAIVPYYQQLIEKSYTFSLDLKNETVDFVHLSDKNDLNSIDQIIEAKIPYYVIDGSTRIKADIFNTKILPLIQ